MHLILTGATGLIGTAVLDVMIRTKDVTKISVITRRPIKFTDDRINVILHKDFTSYDDELLGKLQGAQGCVWALGISQAQVGKEEYIEITKSFPLAAAKAFQSISPDAPNNGTKQPFHFVHVSGAGATTSPGRFTALFGRVKGEAELALAEIQQANPSSFRASTVRPAFIDWTGHAEIKPYLPDLGIIKTAFPYVLSPLMKFAGKSLWSPTEPLGQFLTGMAMGRFDGKLAGDGIETLPGGMAVVENTAFRRLMGLDSKKEEL